MFRQTRFGSLNKGPKGYWQFSGSKKNIKLATLSNLCHFSFLVPYLSSLKLKYLQAL